MKGELVEVIENIKRIAKETGLTVDQVTSVLAAEERIQAEERQAKRDAKAAKERAALNRRLGKA